MAAAKKTVVITGGMGGLGQAMGARFVAEGWQVIAVDLRAADAVPAGVTFIQADVTKGADLDRLWAELAAGGDAIDVLINNAAVSRTHDYANPYTLESDRARVEIEINFAAPIEMARRYLADRRARGHDEKAGSIVNVGAPGGLFPLESIPLYSSTKAGLHMFTMVLRRQMRGTPVTVVEVFPPSLDTSLAADIDVSAQSGHGADVIAQVASEIFTGIAEGVEVILPHKQTRNLFKALPQIDEAFIDMVNQGVVRRPGWDKL